MPATREGGCLCGAVRYAVEGDLPASTNCHCRFCRRAHGAAFVTTVFVPTARLRVLRGDEEVARYEGRFFCRRCASRLWNRSDGFPDGTSLVVASLDEEPAREPVCHMNVGSMAPWYRIRDDAQRFAAFPPGVEAQLDGASGPSEGDESA